MSEISDILTKLGYNNLRSFSGYFRVNPIYRNSNNKGVLSINASNGRFQDWARQGESTGSGDLIKLVSLHLNCSLKEAEKWLKDENYEVENDEIAPTSGKLYEQTGIDVPFFSDLNLSKITNDHQYWLNRNVSLESLTKLKAGLDNGVERGKMSGRYVFPIFDIYEKSVLGFAGRDVTSKSKIKWKLIGKKSSWAYPFFLNKEGIAKKSQVILVESIGDLLSLMTAGVDNVLVCFGLSVGQEINSLLINLKIKTIIIAFNNDSNNNFSGNEASLKALNLIKKNTNKECRICLPQEKNDFGEMNINEIKRWGTKYEIHI